MLGNSRWFSSERERNLWLLSALVVATIYATLELAGSLAGVMAQAGLFDAAFGMGALLAFVAILVAALTTADRTTLGVAMGVAATYVLVFARLGSPAERTHLVEYGVVALLIHAALAERAVQGVGVRRPALLAVIVTSLLGVIDEGIQWLLPSRVFDPIDIGFNVLAAAMAVVAVTVLRRRRPVREHP